MIERNSNNKYLIVKGCAGIGNRLVTVFSAIEYAKKNNRILIVDWSDGQFDKKGINAFNKCFNLKLDYVCELTSIKNWEKLNHSSNLFKGDKEAGIYDLYKSYESSFFNRLNYRLFFTENLKKIKRKWKPINGQSNSLNYGSDLSNSHKEDVLYYVDFLPVVNYASLPYFITPDSYIENIINSFSLNYDFSKAIGIHIRATDKSPTKDVNRIIEHLNHKHKNVPVFLATDNAKIESMFIENFQNVILYPKTKPNLKDEGLHQWALYNNEDNLKYKIYEEAVVEMFLLSKCNVLYYQGNSTFSCISKVYHLNKNNCYDWLLL